VIAVSGGNTAARQECMSAGADVHLQEAAGVHDLLETLGSLVAGSGG
jgi:hypothetical protein